MKKVGIITTFRQPNFGSVLQAFALEYVIEKMGYDVALIDYKYPNEYHWKAGAKHGCRKITLRNRFGDIKRKLQLLLHLRKPTKMEKLSPLMLMRHFLIFIYLEAIKFGILIRCLET